METKLQIHGHSYVLIHNGKTVAFAHPNDFSSDDIIGKLSLKNCEAIKNGYDLVKLSKDFANDHEKETDMAYEFGRDMYSFREGFKKALEILGDKKFSEFNMRICFYEGKWGDNFGSFGPFLQSLQPTEWEVEVEMEYDESCCKDNCQDPELDICDDGCAMATPIPKLDSEGCLILKGILKEK